MLCGRPHWGAKEEEMFEKLIEEFQKLPKKKNKGRILYFNMWFST